MKPHSKLRPSIIFQPMTLTIIGLFCTTMACTATEQMLNSANTTLSRPSQSSFENQSVPAVAEDTPVQTPIPHDWEPLAPERDDLEDILVARVATMGALPGWLAQHPNWEGYAYPDDEAGVLWGVEYYVPNEGEDEETWLGYVLVDIVTGEFAESFIPEPLSTEELQARRPQVQALALADPQVMALMEDPAQWLVETDYDPYEAAWFVYLGRGLEEYYVVVYPEGDGYFIEDVFDLNVLSEEEAREDARNQAIDLAYSAEGVDTALEGVDNWTTYVEQQDGSFWSVAFVQQNEELFFALVDIEAGTILETSP